MQIITNKNQKEIKEHGSYQFPILISNEKLSKYEFGSFLWHWHPEIEITLVRKGQIIYKINDNIYHLRQGSSLFCNAAALHAGSMYKNQDCEYISITFDPKLIYGYENSIFYSKYVSPVTQNLSLSSICFDLSELWHKDAADILLDISEVWQCRSSSYEIDILIHLEHFWRLLFLNYNFTLSTITRNKRDYDRIRNILSYIETNYTSKLTLEGISEHIHLCKSECCRLFRHYMNISLFEFLLEYRIEKSLSYLTNSNYSIIEIAENVGFNDSNYYSKVFCKIKGYSPTKYRKNFLNQNKSV